MIRLFVALDLPEHVRDRLTGLCNGVPGIRWVEPSDMHLTLRFIGEVEEPLLPDIDHALSTVRSSSFSLILEGVHIFGDRRRLRTLWAGIHPCELLSGLQLKIESALVKAGLDPEHRKFHPHVTLARLKGMKADKLGAYLQANAAFKSETFSLSEFTLYSSRLGRAGAVYAPIFRYSLVSA